jgi:hypothetical protein
VVWRVDGPMGYMYMSRWRYGEVEEAMKHCSAHDGVAALQRESVVARVYFWRVCLSCRVRRGMWGVRDGYGEDGQPRAGAKRR